MRNFIRSHPLATGAVVIGSVLVIGAFVLATRPGGVREYLGESWSAPPVREDIYVRTPRERTRGTASTTHTTAHSLPTYASLEDAAYMYESFARRGGAATETDEDAAGAQIDELLAALSTSDTDNGGADTEHTYGTSLDDIYALLPGGTIDATQPVIDEELSDDQEALHAYALEAGAHIESYAQENSDQHEILQSYFDNRSDADARSGSEMIADDLVTLGERLENIEVVPGAVAHAHATVAETYAAMGAQLHTALEQDDDVALHNELTTYNEVAEENAGGFIAIAETLSAHDVPISEESSASVFLFTPQLIPAQ